MRILIVFSTQHALDEWCLRTTVNTNGPWRTVSSPGSVLIGDPFMPEPVIEGVVADGPADLRGRTGYDMVIGDMSLKPDHAYGLANMARAVLLRRF